MKKVCRSSITRHDALSIQKEYVADVIDKKKLLYYEYSNFGKYIIVLDGDEYSPKTSRRRYEYYIMHYKIPDPYAYWGKNNPGWKGDSTGDPTQLERVMGTDMNVKRLSLHSIAGHGRRIWSNHAAGSEAFTREYISKNLAKYIERHKTIDTEQAQKARMADILKRELAIDKELREAISDLKSQGHSWPPQEILDDYFGGVPLGTSHLNEHFIGNGGYYLKPKANLDSTTTDFSLLELAKHYKGVADRRTHDPMGRPLRNKIDYKLL